MQGFSAEHHSQGHTPGRQRTRVPSKDNLESSRLCKELIQQERENSAEDYTRKEGSKVEDEGGSEGGREEELSVQSS